MMANNFNLNYIFMHLEIHIIYVKTRLVLSTKHVFEKVNCLFSKKKNLALFVNLDYILSRKSHLRNTSWHTITHLHKLMSTIKVYKRELYR